LLSLLEAQGLLLQDQKMSFEEMMAEKLLNLVGDINLQIQEVN
jgi:hypothetical protein